MFLEIPREEESPKLGWRVKYTLLQAVCDEVNANIENNVSMEEVDDVIIALEKMGYVTFQRTQPKQ